MRVVSRESPSGSSTSAGLHSSSRASRSDRTGPSVNVSYRTSPHATSTATTLREAVGPARPGSSTMHIK